MAITFPGSPLDQYLAECAEAEDGMEPLRSMLVTEEPLVAPPPPPPLSPSFSLDLDDLDDLSDSLPSPHCEPLNAAHLQSALKECFERMDSSCAWFHLFSSYSSFSSFSSSLILAMISCCCFSLFFLLSCLLASAPLLLCLSLYGACWAAAAAVSLLLLPSVASLRRRKHLSLLEGLWVGLSQLEAVSFLVLSQLHSAQLSRMGLSSSAAARPFAPLLRMEASDGVSLLELPRHRLTLSRALTAVIHSLDSFIHSSTLSTLSGSLNASSTSSHVPSLLALRRLRSSFLLRRDLVLQSLFALPPVRHLALSASFPTLLTSLEDALSHLRLLSGPLAVAPPSPAPAALPASPNPSRRRSLLAAKLAASLESASLGGCRIRDYILPQQQLEERAGEQEPHVALVMLALEQVKADLIAASSSLEALRVAMLGPLTSDSLSLSSVSSSSSSSSSSPTIASSAASWVDALPLTSSDLPSQPQRWELFSADTFTGPSEHPLPASQPPLPLPPASPLQNQLAALLSNALPRKCAVEVGSSNEYHNNNSPNLHQDDLAGLLVELDASPSFSSENNALLPVSSDFELVDELRRVLQIRRQSIPDF